MAGSTQISNETASRLAAADPPKSADERAKSDLWIFREGRREVSGPGMVRDLAHRLASNHSLLDSLIQAGELEAALADVNAPGLPDAAALTNALAVAVCGGNQVSQTEFEQLTARIEVPETVSISPPEGFTYYAL